MGLKSRLAFEQRVCMIKANDCHASITENDSRRRRASGARGVGGVGGETATRARAEINCRGQEDGKRGERRAVMSATRWSSQAGIDFNERRTDASQSPLCVCARLQAFGGILSDRSASLSPISAGLTLSLLGAGEKASCIIYILQFSSGSCFSGICSLLKTW